MTPTTKLVLNGIWFSKDGSLPKSVMDNCEKISQEIKDKDPFAYKLQLWVNQEPNEKDKNKLLPLGVEVKHFSNGLLLEKSLKEKINQIIDSIIKLGTQKEVLPYVIASDIFRFFLMTTGFTDAKDTLVLYFDVNDCIFNTLPNPTELKNKLKGVDIAVDVTSLMFYGLSHYVQAINNDIIVVNPENSKLMEKLFIAQLFHLEYLNLIFQEEGGLTGKLKKTMVDLANDRTRSLREAIVFSVGHTFNILQPKNNQKMYALTWGPEYINVTELPIHNVKSLLDVGSDSASGLTWAENAVTHEAVDHNAFWMKYIRKKRVIIDQSILLFKNKVPLKESTQFFLMFPGFCLQISKGFMYVINSPQSHQAYIELLNKIETYDQKEMIKTLSVIDQIAQIFTHFEEAHVLMPSTVSNLLKFIGAKNWRDLYLSSQWIATSFKELADDELLSDHTIQLLLEYPNIALGIKEAVILLKSDPELLQKFEEALPKLENTPHKQVTIFARSLIMLQHANQLNPITFSVLTQSAKYPSAALLKVVAQIIQLNSSVHTKKLLEKLLILTNKDQPDVLSKLLFLAADIHKKDRSNRDDDTNQLIMIYHADLQKAEKDIKLKDFLQEGITTIFNLGRLNLKSYKIYSKLFFEHVYPNIINLTPYHQDYFVPETLALMIGKLIEATKSMDSNLKRESKTLLSRFIQGDEIYIHALIEETKSHIRKATHQPDYDFNVQDLIMRITYSADREMQSFRKPK